jgi:hypothetical protein
MRTAWNRTPLPRTRRFLTTEVTYNPTVAVPCTDQGTRGYESLVIPFHHTAVSAALGYPQYCEFSPGRQVMLCRAHSALAVNSRLSETAPRLCSLFKGTFIRHILQRSPTGNRTLSRSLKESHASQYTMGPYEGSIVTPSHQQPNSYGVRDSNPYSFA